MLYSCGGKKKAPTIVPGPGLSRDWALLGPAVQGLAARPIPLPQPGAEIVEMEMRSWAVSGWESSPGG